MNTARSSREALRRLHWMGLAVLVMIFGGVGGWAVTTDIAAAVVTQGSLVVDSHVKKVQHPQGGVVAAIYKQDGDRVEDGELLALLDATTATANAKVAASVLDELDARRARLEAEREGLEVLSFAERLQTRSNEPSAAQAMANELALFSNRRAARQNLRQQLEERIAQLEHEIPALEAQRNSKEKELGFVEKELKGANQLSEKKLYPISKLTVLERDAARLNGEREALVAAQVKAKYQIAETKLKIAQIQHDLANEAAKELKDVDSRSGEIRERKAVAEDQLRRTEIRAPQGGTIHQSVLHTVGGVVNGGEILMLIVPEGDPLVIEARLDPRNVDQVHPGQAVIARFTSFNQRTSPEISGKVLHVAADVSQDAKTGQAFFPMRIALNSQTPLRDVKLISGMAAEVFIMAGERSAASYLLKPLSDQFMRAFREQ